MEQVVIQPFEYDDILTGHKIVLRVSPHYSTLMVDERTYYFTKETGRFDGTSMPANREID